MTKKHISLLLGALLLFELTHEMVHHVSQEFARLDRR